MVRMIGKHRITNSDVRSNQDIEQLFGDDQVDLFYCDPPWGTALMKRFDTMREKATGVKPSGDYDLTRLLVKIFQYAKKHTKQDGWIVIEYGKKWDGLIKDIASDTGLIFCERVECKYPSGTNYEYLFRKDDLVRLDITSLETLSGYPVVRAMFNLLGVKEGQTAVDLCCGMGYTARACIENNMRFFGNEYNAARLGKTIDKLERDMNK